MKKNDMLQKFKDNELQRNKCMEERCKKDKIGYYRKSDELDHLSLRDCFKRNSFQ